jgi:hypothetical protein
MPESQGSLVGAIPSAPKDPVSQDVPRPRRAGREQHTPPVLLPSHFYSSPIHVATVHRERLEAFEAWKSSCAASFDELAEKGSINKRFSDTRRLTSSGTRYRVRDYMTVSGVLAWRAGRATSKRAAVAAG